MSISRNKTHKSFRCDCALSTHAYVHVAQITHGKHFTNYVNRVRKSLFDISLFLFSSLFSRSLLHFDSLSGFVCNRHWNEDRHGEKSRPTKMWAISMFKDVCALLERLPMPVDCSMVCRLFRIVNRIAFFPSPIPNALHVVLCVYLNFDFCRLFL